LLKKINSVYILWLSRVEKWDALNGYKVQMLRFYHRIYEWYIIPKRMIELYETRDEKHPREPYFQREPYFLTTLYFLVYNRLKKVRIPFEWTN
jgi:hypothetical protein